MLKFKIKNILPSSISRENNALQLLQKCNHSFQIFKQKNNIRKNNPNIDIYSTSENKGSSLK